VELELAFAKAQMAAGADLISIGDAAASLVGPAIYEQLVWPYEKKLIDALHALGARVRLHICGNTRDLLGKIGALGCEIVDLDYLARSPRPAPRWAAAGAAGQYRPGVGAAQSDGRRGI